VFEYLKDGLRYAFKSKGAKHQNSKVKTLNTVDTEKLDSLHEFVEYAVTENRLMQGITKMQELGKELCSQTTGDYLRWVIGDVIKEENDTIIKNQLDPKKLNPIISNKARVFWINHLNSLVK